MCVNSEKSDIWGFGICVSASSEARDVGFLLVFRDSGSVARASPNHVNNRYTGLIRLQEQQKENSE